MFPLDGRIGVLIESFLPGYCYVKKSALHCFWYSASLATKSMLSDSHLGTSSTHFPPCFSHFLIIMILPHLLCRLTYFYQDVFIFNKQFTMEKAVGLPVKRITAGRSKTISLTDFFWLTIGSFSVSYYCSEQMQSGYNSCEQVHDYILKLGVP